MAATAQLLTDLAEALATRGHEVHVVCSRSGYDGGGRRLPTEDVRNGVRIHRVTATGMGRRRFLHRICDYATFYTTAMMRCLALPRMDVFVGLTTPPFVAGIGALYKEIKGGSLVVWAMDLYPEVAAAMGLMRPTSLEYKLLRGAAGWTYRRADRVISLASEMTDKLIAAGVSPQRIRTIPNWSPGEAVMPSTTNQTSFRHHHGINGHFVVMYSGNMGVVHEFNTILTAAQRLRHRQDVMFLFVGEGAQKRRIVDEARRRNLDNVQFFPYQPLDHLSDSLGAADVHLISMKAGVEGLLVPSKLYGILAAGRPAVLIGPKQNEIARTLTESRAGWVVPPGQGAELADRIETLLVRPDLLRQMGQSARRHYECRCSRELRAAELVTAIETSPR